MDRALLSTSELRQTCDAIALPRSAARSFGLATRSQTKAQQRRGSCRGSTRSSAGEQAPPGDDSSTPSRRRPPSFRKPTPKVEPEAPVDPSDLVQKLDAHPAGASMRPSDVSDV